MSSSSLFKDKHFFTSPGLFGLMDIERVNIFLLIPVRLHVAASALYGNENEGGPIGLGTFKTKNLSTDRMKSTSVFFCRSFIYLFLYFTWHLLALLC